MQLNSAMSRDLLATVPGMVRYQRPQCPYRMLQLITAAIPGRVRMHLQKCNLKIWNALPLRGANSTKRIHNLSRKGAIAREERKSIPEKGPRMRCRRSWLRGSVKFGTVYVPDSHPTLLNFLGFLVLFWLVGLWSGSWPRGRTLAALEHA